RLHRAHRGMLGQKSTRPLPDQTALNRGHAMAGRPLRILTAVFLLGGCSAAAEVTGTATQHDLVQIRADVASLQASARQLKAQAEGLGPQVDGRLRYQAAYIDFSKGAYQIAITNFREFIRRFPDHKLAGNAQYWVGEAYFSLARGFTDGAQSERAQEELGKAIQEFRKVVANYPRGEKTPAALYKEALALIELKQPQVAQARLQYLVDNFPQAEETPMARERLTALKDR